MDDSPLYAKCICCDNVINAPDSETGITHIAITKECWHEGCTRCFADAESRSLPCIYDFCSGQALCLPDETKEQALARHRFELQDAESEHLAVQIREAIKVDELDLETQDKCDKINRYSFSRECEHAAELYLETPVGKLAVAFRSSLKKAVELIHGQTTTYADGVWTLIGYTGKSVKELAKNICIHVHKLDIGLLEQLEQPGQVIEVYHDAEYVYVKARGSNISLRTSVATYQLEFGEWPVPRRSTARLEDGRMLQYVNGWEFVVRPPNAHREKQLASVERRKEKKLNAIREQGRLAVEALERKIKLIEAHVEALEMQLGLDEGGSIPVHGPLVPAPMYSLKFTYDPKAHKAFRRIADQFAPPMDRRCWLSPAGLTRTKYAIFPLSENCAVGCSPDETWLIGLQGDVHLGTVEPFGPKIVVSRKPVQSIIADGNLVWIQDADGDRAYRTNSLTQVDEPPPDVTFDLGRYKESAHLPNVVADFASIRTYVWFVPTSNSHLKVLDVYVY